ncbi:MAG: polyhydroxyalkanoate synthesis regulator DNA-binding domain-containing protein [Candidatus Rokuibacteriota bacterium]
MDETVLIKRYANRKLYDQSRSRYVTLDELAELIRQGREIRVVEAASGDDLTSLTLAQIILEAERDRRSVLPSAFLHQLIKHGETWTDFVQQSLQASLAGVVQTQREAERVLREWGTRAGWWPATSRPSSPPDAKPGAELEDLRAEVAALKAKLRDLESRLAR